MADILADKDFWNGLLRQVARRASWHSDPEDLLHSAYLRFARYRSQHTVENVSSFLVRSAINIGIDNYRHERFTAEFTPEEVGECEDFPLQDEVLAARARLERVKAGLAMLPPRTREIFLMHRLDNLKYREIAKQLGISQSAVEKHVAKAVLFFNRLDKGLVTLRNFDDFPEGHPQRIRAESAAWMARLQADNRGEADEQAFRLWLNADPRNAEAFEAVDNIWNLIGGLAQETRTEAGVTAEPRRFRRRALLSGLGLMIIAGGTVSFWRPSSAKVYETDVGEQKHVALVDGSQMFLDTQTRVLVDYSDVLRSVDLQYGRASFRVESDQKRPFVVQAAERKVVATGSNFDVRCDGKRVQVILIHGAASIRSDEAAATATVLYPGDRLIAMNGTTTRDKPDLAPLLAWQTGQAIFENELLSDAVQEINRYSAEKLEVEDSQIGGMRVSGAYRVGDNDAFAHSVAELLGISVDVEDEKILLVADNDVRKPPR